MTELLNRPFDLFQLAMLILFLVTFGGRTLYMQLARGINPITLGNKQWGVRQIVEMLFPIWLVLLIIEVLRASLDLPLRILPAIFDLSLIIWLPAQVFGVALSVVGYGLFIAALLSFGDSWRVGVDEQKAGALVTGGIFAISRNPIFVFMNLYMIGSFLINGTLIFLLFAIGLIAALHYQILQEEKFLLKMHGNTYQAYLNRTARYLPLLRQSDLSRASMD